MANLTIPKSTFVEYQQIYFEVYGTKISLEDAISQGTTLLRMFQLIYQPVPKDWEKSELKVGENKKRI